MSERRYKPPPETFGFVVLKLFCTLIVLAAVLGLYGFVLLSLVIAARPPEWVTYVVLAVWLALSAITYELIRATSFGRYLCEWPRYY